MTSGELSVSAGAAGARPVKTDGWIMETLLVSCEFCATVCAMVVASGGGGGGGGESMILEFMIFLLTMNPLFELLFPVAPIP